MTTITPRHERIQAHLQACLGPNLTVVCTGVDGDAATIWPEEEAAVSGAILKRRREFAAGRTAAREAMRRLSGTAAAIPAQPDRSPRWPPGISGSISHTHDTCLVVVGHQASWPSIGIDLEPDQGIEESLWGIICTPRELDCVRQQPPSAQAACVARLFVAKEAFYKWHYPLSKVMLDFQEVSVHWIHDGCSFKVDLSGLQTKNDIDVPEGRLIALEGQLFACCAGTSQQSFVP